MERNINIIQGQRIQRAKLQRAKELRHNQTSAEKLLWGQLRNNQLGGFHFRRQQVIAGFIVDFYCSNAKLVVEVDGDIHKSTVAYDTDRDQLLQSHGLKIIRFTNREITNNLPQVLDQILTSCTSF